MFVLLLLAAVAVAAAPMLLSRYRARLPVAPLCPSCRGVTAGIQWAKSAFRWLPIALATHRRCSRCGWHGLMRWQWAVEPSGDPGR